jgi:gentisate 1,2-dioxygenase
MFDLRHGDIVVVPSWCQYAISANSDLDLFMFSDAPVFDALNLARHEQL